MSDTAWDFFFTELNDNPASIAIDLGLKKSAPVKELGCSLGVFISMNNPAENGLSSREESEELFKIEDALVDIINRLGGVFAGRVTNDGVRSLHFYAGKKDEAEKAVGAAMKDFIEYTYSVECKLDKEWKDYFEFLYPSPSEMQTILNRRVINNLVKQGDSLKTPRKVSHYIYFKNEDDRKKFKTRSGKAGFEAASMNYIKDSDDYPYSLRVVRSDSVEPHEVDDYTMYLFDLSEQYNGIYDGWETMLVK